MTVALRIYIATVLRRYTFVLEDPNEKVNDFSITNPPPPSTEYLFACSSALAKGSPVDQPLLESA